MNVSYVSAELAFTDWKKYQPKNIDVDPKLIYRFINNSLYSIIPANQMSPTVALIPVSDYNGILPPGFHYEKMVLAWCGPKRIEQGEFVEWIAHDEKCEYKVKVLCNYCDNPKDECDCMDKKHNIIINLDNYADRVAYDDRAMEKSKFATQIVNTMKYARKYKRYNPEDLVNHDFKIIKPANGAFYNTSSMIENCHNISFDVELGYRVELPLINVNFKEGQLLISYLGHKLDDRGLLLVPQHSHVFKAIRDSVDLEYYTYMYKMTEGKSQFYREMMDRMNIMAPRSIRKATIFLKKLPPNQLLDIWKNQMHRMVPDNNYNENLQRRSVDFFDLIRNFYD